MILNPAIIALLSGLTLAVAMTLYASWIGVRILRSWDIQSGSERQLALERKTYLISTVLAYVMLFELFSLFIFIYTVDQMHALFVGAMCAAGTLNVNGYGYSTLIVKLVVFVLCGTWLILNYADNLGFDYPLIRTKYRFLMVITGCMLLEWYLQLRYFTLLQPDVITSCCGALFSTSGERGVAGSSGLPERVMKSLFFLGLALTLRTGGYTWVTGRGSRLFASLSGGLLLVSLVSVISFISVYYYELPTHHCPFCLLQGGYHHIGYPLYMALFAAGIAGIGVGVLERFRGVASLREAIPAVQKRLCLASVIGYALFGLIALYPMLFSSFSLEGY